MLKMRDWFLKKISMFFIAQDDLKVAAWFGDEERVSSLLELGVPVDFQDEYGRTALMSASQEGHIGVVRLLLKARANVNLQDKLGWTALSEAVERNNEVLVDLLLTENAQIDCPDMFRQTVLMKAAEKGYIKIAEL